MVYWYYMQCGEIPIGAAKNYLKTGAAFNASTFHLFCSIYGFGKTLWWRRAGKACCRCQLKPHYFGLQARRFSWVWVWGMLSAANAEIRYAVRGWEYPCVLRCTNALSTIQHRGKILNMQSCLLGYCSIPMLPLYALNHLDTYVWLQSKNSKVSIKAIF